VTNQRALLIWASAVVEVFATDAQAGIYT